MRRSRRLRMNSWFILHLLRRCVASLSIGWYRLVYFKLSKLLLFSVLGGTLPYIHYSYFQYVLRITSFLRCTRVSISCLKRSISLFISLTSCYRGQRLIRTSCNWLALLACKLCRCFALFSLTNTFKVGCFQIWGDVCSGYTRLWIHNW